MSKFWNIFGTYISLSHQTVDVLVNAQNGGVGCLVSDDPNVLDLAYQIKANGSYDQIIAVFNSRRDTESEARRVVGALCAGFKWASNDKIILLDNGRFGHFFTSLAASSPFRFLFALTVAILSALTKPVAAMKFGILNFLAGGLINQFTALSLNGDRRQLLILLTSNNRLAEALRLSFVLGGGHQVEVLHGLCTEEFSKYYSLINREVSEHNARIGYINFFASLPQPRSIDSGLLHPPAGVKWPISSESPSDQVLDKSIVIIGGSTGDDMQAYASTPYFGFEADVISFCRANNIRFKYFAHPKLGDDIIKRHGLLGDEASVGIKGYQLSNCYLCGCFSTALFEHDASNKIFVLRDGFDRLGDEFHDTSLQFEVGDFGDFSKSHIVQNLHVGL